MKWISVKDYLPNTEQPVLTYSKKNINSEIIELSAIDSDGIWYCVINISEDIETPLYWMHLPNPPMV